MSLITPSAGAPATEIEPGTYPVTLMGLELKTIVVQQEERTVYEWRFAVDGEEDVFVNGLTSDATGPKSKAGAYLVALLGPDAVIPGRGFELEDLVGKRALATVELNANGYPRITNIVAPPRAVKRTVRAQAAPEAGADDLPF